MSLLYAARSRLEHAQSYALVVYNQSYVTRITINIAVKLGIADKTVDGTIK